MIRIKRTKEDINVLEEIDRLGVTPSKLEGFDFRNTAVIKPWGYEYLAYEKDAKEICAWVLHMQNNSPGTSIHCHRTKKTRIIVLKGKFLLKTFHKELELSEGGEVVVDELAFHSIRALTNNCVITEIESPSFKPDAVRWKDIWGRDRQEYESQSKLVKTVSLSCPYKTDHYFFQEIMRLVWETEDIFESMK